MKDRIENLQQRILGMINEEMQSLVDDLLKGLVRPEKILELLQSMGLDASALSGMMGGSGSFDAYHVLGLNRSATDEEVRQRYRELAKILHPDKSGTQATSKFFEIVQRAYDLIRLERGW